MFGEMLVVYGTFIASLCPQSKSILITYWLFHRRRQSTTLFAVHLSVHCLRIVNDEGKRVTEKDFMGKWSLVYFGFTHCPDICPDELQKLAAAVDKIKEKAGIEVVPVFISVDPERDTVEQVHEYVKEFHPKLVGLTGSPDEIKKVARAYRVYYMKTAEEDSDYLVDHSIVMYLMDPKMEFVKFFGKNNDIDSLTDGVIKEIKQHKK